MFSFLHNTYRMQAFFQGIFNILVFVVFLALLLKLVWYVFIDNYCNYTIDETETRELAILS